MSRALRSTELGLLGLAVALTLAIIAICKGVADAPNWLPEHALAVDASERVRVPSAPTASLQSLSNTWKSPLFSPDRSPDQAVNQAASASLSGLTLTGVLIQGDLRIAWLKRNDGPPLTVHQGQSLPNGWRLESLTSAHAYFSFQGLTQRLALIAPRLPPPSTTPPISLSHESTQ